MKPSSLVPFSVVFAAFVVWNAHAADTTPAPREPGESWEVTTTMSMEGMEFALPPQTQRVCAAKEWTKPPMEADKRSKCEIVDFANTPAKSTWKMRCAGPPQMTGEGEITRTSPSAYEGWMKMSSREGVMTTTLAGRRVGECDAGESRREMAETRGRMEAQVAAGEKMAAEAQKQACDSIVEKLDLRLMHMMSTTCNEPSLKVAFCERFGTPEGFELVCKREEKDAENGLAAIGTFCGSDSVAMKTAACAEALEKENLDLLGKCCPEETRQLALRECAGRKYTQQEGWKYRGFCIGYASDLMQGGPNAPATEEPEKEKSKTKKLLKGIFSR